MTLELESSAAVMFKGPGGLNEDRAYTIDKRAYDGSMMGILAMSSPDSSKVGVSRKLSMNPRILGTRGYIKPNDMKSVNELQSSNIGGFAELLTPFVIDHDDSPRVGMNTAQSNHVVPVEVTDKLLMGNGSEKTAPFILGDDFVHTAKENGEIIDYNEKLGMMVIQYKSGKKEIVDLRKNVAKNGNGGFFISNQKKTDLKIGDKVKKGESIGVNDIYFKNHSAQKKTYAHPEFAIGKLTKLAVGLGSYTFEDSCIVSEKYSKEMTTYVTMDESVVLGKNSNVLSIVKKGQEIKTGEPMIVFDESFDDDSTNKFLASIEGKSDNVKNLADLSQNSIKSKYTGVVEDIKVYTTVDTSELSPTLSDVVKEYWRDINKYKNFVKKYVKEKDNNIIFPPTDVINDPNGKVMGATVGEGVLIVFYIKYRDQLGIGDKVTAHTALKSIVSEVIPSELAPYSEYRPDEEIEYIMSMISISARMTSSIWLALFGNKVMIELKRQIADIWES